ncbi:DEKNAAC103815 [Brettanomyces naardenensis]|uniref:DEKNAAC103815 n=1 Tax=Brettanomyces naardenensis TaxID=13370 RepID=A0A448YPD1_BRENA|nr:DEKNAAC103815 [Brettanomyces naardenensis]
MLRYLDSHGESIAFYTRGGSTATSRARAAVPVAATANGLNVPDLGPINTGSLIDINMASSNSRPLPNVAQPAAYIAQGNGAGFVTLSGGQPPNGVTSADRILPSSVNVKPSNTGVFNQQLFSFNILSIDPKLNPLSLPPEQQSLIQIAYLAKLHYDQQFSNALQYSEVNLRPNQCLNCSRNLSLQRLGKQLCEACESKPSIVRQLNYYLTILKVNRHQDLYKVIFLTNISVENLLKSSLSADRSRQNILNKLYDKYVSPINETAGAEFIFLKEQPLAAVNEEDSNGGENHHHESPVIRKFLKCAKDLSASRAVSDENIDPEALKLEGSKESTFVKPLLTSNHGCNSLICLSYDTRNGDLVICFTHQAHL